jgi:hypothetical protein
MTEEREPTELDYPGIESAQAFILPSYQWLLTRLEAADSRLQALVTLTATVTLAAPALGKALHPNISFRGWAFVLAMILAALVVLGGIGFRVWGALVLPDPAVFYAKWREKTKLRFQADALYFAGQHLQSNTRLVARKAAAVTAFTGMFIGELALLFQWLAHG